MPAGVYEHRKAPASELFEARIERTDSCWNWVGTIALNGYGTIKIGGRKGSRVYAHRLAYSMFVGPIPDGMDLDHLCRNRRCANPSHLEPVTRQTNVLRGVGPSLLGKLNGAKTQCKSGHAFDDANTRYRPSGGRTCRECERNRRRAAD